MEKLTVLETDRDLIAVSIRVFYVVYSCHVLKRRREDEDVNVSLVKTGITLTIKIWFHVFISTSEPRINWMISI